MYKQVLTGLAITLIAASAHAGTPAMEQVDTDKDGIISTAEAATAGISEEIFLKADMNQDGKLDAGEYAALLKG
ncbi:MAG: EF-hand domain-containing protein [Desulfobulbaceae bacterium]|nr:EF-hand domain-containing protein [Desulfobulbaceae bacterium]